MAADRSKGGTAWLGLAAGLGNSAEPSEGAGNGSFWLEVGGYINRDVGEDPLVGGRTEVSDEILSENADHLVELLHPVPDEPNLQNFRRDFGGESSSTLLTLSPPQSSRWWEATTSGQCEHVEHGDPLTPLDGWVRSDSLDGETNAAYLSDVIGSERDFRKAERAFESRINFANQIDYVPLQRWRVKAKVGVEHVVGTSQTLEPSLQGTLQAGTELEAAAAAGSFVQAYERSQLQVELKNLQQVPPRMVIQNVMFPDRIHRKRAKLFPLLSRLIPSSDSSMGGSSLATSNSSDRQSLQYKGWQKTNLSLGLSSNPSLCSQGNGESNMDTDDAGDEDKEDNIEEMEDNEPRFDLTDDLLLKVFSFLSHVDLCQAAMVCRQWHAASVHEDFWKSLNFENRQVSQAQVVELCVRYPRATELHLKGAPCVDELLVRETIRSLRNIEVLTLGRSFLSEIFFYALSERASLQKLSITDAILGTGGAQEIQLRHEGLRLLQIVKCRVLRIAIRCPQLETLSLRRTGTASAMLICPRLTSLDVAFCHKLSDAGVRAAAIACPLLRSLDMSNCAYVTDETLREIAFTCSHLRTLDASYCPNVSLEGVRLPTLTELRLQSCEGINSSSMTALSHCVMLEVLVMDCCWLLTSVNLDLPHLRDVSLGNNRKLMELTLRSPFLVSLNLEKCPSLNRIDLTSSSIPRLDLKQQLGLANMALQCPLLQVVDLSDCESLTDLVCNVFSDGGGCPKLNSLILDNCDGLVKVKLSTSSLEKLSLMGCKKVSILELSCPLLQNLQLDGSDRLIDASFAPVGLHSLNLGICPHLTNLVIKADQMTTLDLRGCGVLSQAFIMCPLLSSLDASYCSQLGDDCVVTTTSACPGIQHLVLAACFAVGPAGLLALRKLVDLTTLDLSYTFLTDLSPIFEACPRLKVLKLSACKYLDETALDALHRGKKLSELQELDISYGSLGRTAIEGVLAHCPHLIHISLNGCAYVTDHLWTHLCAAPVPVESITVMDTSMRNGVTPDAVVEYNSPLQLHPGHREWSSQDNSTFLKGDDNRMDVSEEMTDTEGNVLGRALQNLLCVGCQNVRSVLIPARTCLHLLSINLSLSYNIREVYLTCINLTTLNLSNCTALVVLELDCPRLVTLLLQSCGIEAEMLEAALYGCTMLETLDLRNCAKVSAADLAPIRGMCPGIKRLYSTTPPENRLLTY